MTLFTYLLTYSYNAIRIIFWRKLLLHADEIKYVVLNKYGLVAEEVEKVKNVYKITTKDGTYCLKVVRYDFGHFLFILGAIKHLQNNGFKSILEIIKTIDDEEFIAIDGGYAYLTEWIEARQCSYSNPLDLVIAASKLAELHKKSEGFTLTYGMNPRIGWLRWIEIFETRIKEIESFKEIIFRKGKLTDFDKLYLEIMDGEIDKAASSIYNLRNSNYFNRMKKELPKNGFCHHDYANHNVLIEKDGKVIIIDFDFCILDTSLHDLGSLLIRKMKNGKWHLDNARLILDSYTAVNPIERSDIKILSGFIEFPQDYWQVGIQYYFEKQPWEEDFFMHKLLRVEEDREDKSDFIEEFNNFRYC